MSNTGHIANTDLGGRTPGWRRRRARGRLLLLLLTPPAANALAFQLHPAHHVLDIPVTPNKGTGYFWREEQRSQLAYADSPGVLYLRRLVGTAYPHTQGWHTAQEAFTYFDRWLSANGWTYSGDGTPSAGAEAEVPEGRFLKPEQSRRYYRTSDWSVQAVVSVWPLGARVEGFHVVLTTTRPSLARSLLRWCDPAPCEPEDFD
jgi:hypothetical protein